MEPQLERMSEKRKRESTSSSHPSEASEEPPAKRGLSEVVATHYNQIEEVGLEARKESRIYHMRNFNNWTKSMVIGDFLNRIKKEKGYDTRINVLDIGCGKGGDLRKYKIGRINHLVCCDIAETSLSQAKDRYKEMVSYDQKQNNRSNNSYNRQPQRKSLFSADFIHADCTRERLKDKYSSDSPRFDLVSIQFSFHYCFESLSQAECMIRNAAEFLSPGGYVIGTTPDAYDIVRRVRDSESLSFGNDVYSITFSDEMINDETRLPLFGAEYKFHLDGVVDCPEFLVYFPAFVKIAAKYGLKLVFKKRFEDYYHEMKGTRDGSNLLKRMSAFETFPSFGNKKLTGDKESDYSHAKDFVEDLKGKGRSCNQVGTLSASEWEAISLYLVFAFVKVKADK